MAARDTPKRTPEQFRTVGFGPFRIWGERRRMQEAIDEAERGMALVERCEGSADES